MFYNKKYETAVLQQKKKGRKSFELQTHFSQV